MRCIIRASNGRSVCACGFNGETSPKGGKMKHSNVLVTLIEDSMAGYSTRDIPGQIVEITRRAPSIAVGLDGHMSSGAQPSEIMWRGGRAECLSNITSVKITHQDGRVLFEGPMMSSGVPQDVDKGVVFEVL
jgi:hypothetical protein